MKAMDWKRGVGLACLLFTVSAVPARAQSRGPIQEPAGIPVYSNNGQTMGSPFSPEYHAAWYQSQVNRIAYMAWMEHDAMEREAYLADLAARRKAAAEVKAAEKAVEDKDGKVLWTKVGTPKGWGWGQGKIVDSRPAPSSMALSNPAASSKTSTVVVTSPAKMPAVKAAAPMPSSKVMSSTVVSETVYEVKPDGSMVPLKSAPTAVVKSVDAAAPQVIATQPATDSKR